MPHQTIKQKGHSAQLLEKSKPTPPRELKTRGVKTPTASAAKSRQPRSGGLGRAKAFVVEQRTGRTKSPLRPDSIKTKGRQAQINKVLKQPKVQRALKTAERGDTGRSATRTSAMKTLSKVSKVARRSRSPFLMSLALGLDAIVASKKAKKINIGPI